MHRGKTFFHLVTQVSDNASAELFFLLTLCLGFKYVLTENSYLNATIAKYETPYVTHGTIESDGYGMHVCLTLIWV